MSQKNKNSALITYRWKGVYPTGEKTQGVVSAANVQTAKFSLGKQGIIVRRIVKKRIIFQKITSTDISLFTKELANMLSLGIPLVQAFTLIHSAKKNHAMQRLIVQLSDDINLGLSLSDALQRQPKYCNPLLCNLVAAGEKSGRLIEMLQQVAIHQENNETFKKKIKKALMYPLVLLIVACIVSSMLLIYVVPQFEDLFQSLDAELPFITQLVLGLSRFLERNICLIFAGILALMAGFRYMKKYFKIYFDLLILKCPILSTVIKKSALARFSRTLSLTLSAGIPLMDALPVVANVCGSEVYRRATQSIREYVSLGTTLEAAMENTLVFPALIRQIIAMGEATGTLEEMLMKIANLYEDEVANSLDTFHSLLEPIIMSILGLLVGGLVLALYYPLFTLGSLL